MKKRNSSLKTNFIIIIIILVTLFNIFIYIFDSIVVSTVFLVAEEEMKYKALEIINSNILQYYSQNFDYEDIMDVHKDEEGNISMIKANTLKMNSMATEVALNSQKDIRKLGSVGIEIPAGYILKNNILANFGPKIKVKMQPAGHIETKYSSTFESAGINQTRHKIYLEISTDIRIILPLKSKNIRVTNEVPICETIIVGKIPRTAIDFKVEDIKHSIP